MLSKLSKAAVAAVTALSLTFVPMPAAADNNDDIARIIAGLVAAGVIVAAIDQHNDRKKKKATTTPYVGPKLGTIERNGSGRVIYGDVVRPKHITRHSTAKRYPLPDRCTLTVSTNRGNRTAYGKRCLNRNYRYADRLPENCEILVRTSRGVRTVYGARCLDRDGWRVARR